MSSKVTFRARMVDSARPLSIFKAEELPDITDINNMGRSVPALPSGMEKEEEGEKHLQDILAVGLVDTGIVIPTPECSEIQTNPLAVAVADKHQQSSEKSDYDKIYVSEYKQPRQYIHVQPFACNQEIPDYDMDCEDVKFLEEELLSRRKMDVNHFTFEDMMDKLEKNSRVNAVTIKEAKLILKEDDDLILLVYDYWLNKRLATQQSLVPSIKTVNYSQTHNPYVCFRRRTEKMMTRKNRKNEEASYEAMLKLRRDLSRAVTLLDMVRRREKTKKEKLNLTLDIFNKRYNSKDWDGRMLDSVTSSLSRQRLQPSGLNVHNWISMWSQSPPRRSQHSHKMKRRLGGRGGSPRLLESPTDKMISSEDEIGLLGGGSEDEMERGNPFLFTRKEGVEYHAPLDLLQPPDLSHHPDEAFVLTGLRLSRGLRCLGYCRRRVGRGGRVVLDRLDRLEGNYGQGEVTTMTRAVTPPGLEDDMDWDPYMTRQQEEEVSTSATTTTQFNNNKGFKIVDMNRAVAHNAAGALIPSQFVDLFSTPST